MAIIVNTNVSALKTQNNLTMATNSLSKALERLSTGLKINSAADDAAGYFVAAKLSTQISGSKVASSNVATGINVLQTAEGTLDVVEDNITRIRDLAVQAANGIYDTDSLTAMQNEVTARLAEIKRVQTAADFNGIKLFSASAGLGKDGLILQVGANATAAENQIKIEKASFAEVTLTADVSSVAGATAAITACDTALKTIATRKAEMGAVQNRLGSAQEALMTTIENASAALSTIMDADIAEETSNYTKAQILQQTSSTLLIQANNLPSIALTLIRGS